MAFGNDATSSEIRRFGDIRMREGRFVPAMEVHSEAVRLGQTVIGLDGGIGDWAHIFFFPFFLFFIEGARMEETFSLYGCWGSSRCRIPRRGDRIGNSRPGD